MSKETNEFIDEPHHSGLLSVASATEVAVSLENGFAQWDDIVGGDPSIKRDGLSASLRAKESTNKEIEAEFSILDGGHVGEVIDVRMLKEVMRSHHAHIPFPWPICKCIDRR